MDFKKALTVGLALHPQEQSEASAEGFGKMPLADNTRIPAMPGTVTWQLDLLGPNCYHDHVLALLESIWTHY